MTLQQLRYFIVLGELLHFGKAARACLVSQPSLSQSIAELEVELNLKLLTRSSRQVELTPAGKVFYRDVQQVIRDMNKAITRAKRINSGLDGIFKIGTLGGLVANRLFMDNLVSFRRKNKNIDITLVHRNMKKLIMDLLLGSLDVALVRAIDTVHHANELNWASLYQDHFGIMLRKDHPLAYRESIPLSELQDEPFVFLDNEITPNVYNFILQICASRGLVPQIFHTAPSLEIVCTLIKADMGIAILPDCALTYGSNELKFIPIEGDDTCSDVVLAWPRRNMSPIVPLFLEEFGIDG